MSSAAAPRVGVSTGIEDVDAATLSEVFSRLDPASILSASASSKHLASAADEPLWRDVFAKSWDEPVWEVSSYRHLHLVRHRALLLLRSLPDAPPPDDDPDAWLAVADASTRRLSRIERLPPRRAHGRHHRRREHLHHPRRLLRSPRPAYRPACRPACRPATPRSSPRVAWTSRVRTQKPPTSRATPRRKPFHRSSRGVSRGVRPRRYPRGVASRSRRIRLRIVASRRGRCGSRAGARRRDRRVRRRARRRGPRRRSAWPPATPHRPRIELALALVTSTPGASRRR